jgi:NADPH2:quinone reductase
VVPLGAYAAERVLPAERAVKLPAGISYEQAAATMLKGMTVCYLVRRTFPVKKGDTVLIHAAAGGIGLIASQWANALGATVIGTVGTKEKAELARANGCHHTILYRDEDFVARVKEITKRAKATSSMTASARTTFPARSIACIRSACSLASARFGAIEAFNINLLQLKGLAVRDPADAQPLCRQAQRPPRTRRGDLRGDQQRQGEDPDQPDLSAQGSRQGASRSRIPCHHRRFDPLT